MSGKNRSATMPKVKILSSTAIALLYATQAQSESLATSIAQDFPFAMDLRQELSAESISLSESDDALISTLSKGNSDFVIASMRDVANSSDEEIGKLRIVGSPYSVSPFILSSKRYSHKELSDFVDAESNPVLYVTPEFRPFADLINATYNEKFDVRHIDSVEEISDGLNEASLAIVPALEKDINKETVKILYYGGSDNTNPIPDVPLLSSNDEGLYWSEPVLLIARPNLPETAYAQIKDIFQDDSDISKLLVESGYFSRWHNPGDIMDNSFPEEGIDIIMQGYWANVPSCKEVF